MAVDHLDRCPPEICQTIFRMACTDGGLTGCSLSLVSKYIHNASATARYQSVAICGPDALLPFISLLEPKCVSITSFCVQHFFFSRDRLSTGDVPAEATGIRMTNADRRARMHLQAKQIMAAIPRVLTLIGNHLKTLALASTPPQDIPLPHNSLTALEELTIFASARCHVTWIPEEHPTLPSLRRLHLAGPKVDLPNGLKLAPSLTHLRLSGMDEIIMIPQLLKAVPGLCLGGEEFPSPSTPHPLQSIRQIQIHRIPRSLGFGVVRQAYRSACSRTEEFLADHPSDKVSLTNGNLREVRKHIAMEARMIWQDRLKGGLGCWTE
ncbi:hypothetical protein JAAARDRAFT_340828 [Jaapia argillacea MUCL 33604]|uniref:F-box domain-containing protein n=1 Tax=Jaapia argillacea MUCL 33604 TaxID=933084 RepID=A0A067PXK8_9AGAM|nr:hypothetical protein JAAARDRAFT_340828 [Jaapia argillacea MUCL 33604]